MTAMLRSFLTAVCLLSILLLLCMSRIHHLQPFPMQDIRIRTVCVDFSPLEAPENPFNFRTAGSRAARGDARNRAVFVQNTGAYGRSPFSLPPTTSEPVPENYTEMVFSGCEFPVYVFIDSAGQSAYRVRIDRSENGVRKNGFVEARPAMSGTSIQFGWNENAPFVSVREEDFGILSPADAPAESTAGLTRCWGVDGLYCRAEKDGTRRYYFYGTYPGGTPGFVPADSDGKMLPGKLPIIYSAEKEEPTE